MRRLRNTLVALITFFVVFFTLGFHATAADKNISVSLLQQETEDLSRIRYVVTINGCEKEEVTSYDVTLAIDDASGNEVFPATTRSYNDVYKAVKGVNETQQENVCYVVFTLSDIQSFAGYRITAYFTIHVGSESYVTNTKYYEIGTKSSISDLKVSRNNSANIDIRFTPYGTATQASDYTIEYRKDGEGVFTTLSTNPLSLSDGKLSGTITKLNTTSSMPAGNYYYRVTTTIDGVKHTSEEIMVNACDLVPYVDYLIKKTEKSETPYDPAWRTENFKDRWNYIDGVFLNSVVQLSNQLNDNSYMDSMVEFINYYLTEAGQFYKPQSATTTGAYASGQLDTICESRILFDALEYTGNSTRYGTPIETTYNELTKNVKTCSGTTNYNHKNDYPNQIWLDGMYMYGPFYARYAQYKNDSTIFDKLTVQYKYIYEHMRDSETGLLYHGHDTTKSVFWCNKTTGNSPTFWLRSMGWYVASLADVLDYYPEGSNKELLKGYLNDAIRALMNFRDEDSKMFYQIIDEDGSFKATFNGTEYDNYLESSGSSLIAYAAIKGALNGYIDSKYLTMGVEVFEGIYSHSYDPVQKKLSDICKSAGLDTTEKTGARDGSPGYYLSELRVENEAKGVGPFVMAFLQYREALGLTTESKEEEDSTVTKYTVSYQMNGANESYANEEYIEGDKLVLKTPTKTGYTFGGWYSDSNLQTGVNSQTVVTSNMTLYAKWTQNQSSSSKTYITFNSFSAGSISSSTTLSGITLTPKSGKESTIVSKNITLDGQSLTRYFYVGGSGNYSELSVQFTTSKKANITVYYANSTGRFAALYNSSGKIDTATTPTNGSNPVSYTFTNVAAGNLAVCSSGSGIHIYMIVIEYAE